MEQKKDKITRIIFVCSGNLCRSPYAHYRAKQLMPDLEIFSAGIHAGDGDPADSTAVQVSKSFGVDLLAHHTTRFSNFEISPGDLILIKDAYHLNYLRKLGPTVLEKAVLLGSFCRNPEFPLMIADPWGKSEENFKYCFRQIDDALEGLKVSLADQMKERSAS